MDWNNRLSLSAELKTSKTAKTKGVRRSRRIRGLKCQELGDQQLQLQVQVLGAGSCGPKSRSCWGDVGPVELSQNLLKVTAKESKRNQRRRRGHAVATAMAAPPQPVFDDLVPEGESLLEEVLQVGAAGGGQSSVDGGHVVDGPDGLPHAGRHQTLLDGRAASTGGHHSVRSSWTGTLVFRWYLHSSTRWRQLRYFMCRSTVWIW